MQNMLLFFPGLVCWVTDLHRVTERSLVLPTWWDTVLGNTEEGEDKDAFSLFCGEEWLQQLTLFNVTSPSNSSPSSRTTY